MIDKKQNVIKSPDLSKLQPVVINDRTIIYIPINADPEEARNRYLERVGKKP
jgi:putative ubiquitin-RnfH superfamily antitoxin RatB of RatAB toxin-antitoxin module